MQTTDHGARRHSYRTAMAELASAQKPKAGTPLYSRYVNRPLGRRFAAAGAAAGLSPNTISLISFACSLAAVVLIAVLPVGVAAGFTISALLVLGYALDSADGQVARLTKRGSVFGEWLDHVLDCAKIASLHAAVAWHVLRTDVDERWVLVALGWAVVAAVMFFGMILTDQLRRQAGQDRTKHHVRPDSMLRSIAVLPSDYGLMCLLFVTLGWTSVFLGAYTVLLAGNVVLLAAALARWVTILRAV
jgi:phosphatidylglycerophosphate synthase